MKKSIVFSFAVVIALAASVTALANVSTSRTEAKHCVETHVEVASQGKGACRHALCRCTYASSG